MGCGSWTTCSYSTYAASKGRDFDLDTGVLRDDFSSAQEVFKTNRLDEALNPRKIIRECCDNEEHPETFPVILALDVTGSMGNTAIEVAKKLNLLMTETYKKVKDVEFAVMAIGDLAYDTGPIQMSQFESDIRIAENLDKIWFESGGGGNNFESYTAAWYMGARHAKLDCWKRGKKGLIITLGDEKINPYLPQRELENVTGDSLQGSVETKDLYEEIKDKFNVYHLVVKHSHNCESWWNDCRNSFAEVIGKDHVKMSSVEEIIQDITGIIADASEDCGIPAAKPAEVDANGMITW